MHCTADTAASMGGMIGNEDETSTLDIPGKAATDLQVSWQEECLMKAGQTEVRCLTWEWANLGPLRLASK